MASASCPQSRQRARTGTTTRSTAAPSATVPWATRANDWSKADATTRCCAAHADPDPGHAATGGPALHRLQDALAQAQLVHHPLPPARHIDRILK